MTSTSVTTFTCCRTCGSKTLSITATGIPDRRATPSGCTTTTPCLSPLAQKYGIQPQLTLPAALEQELICQQYRFDAHACLEELQADFELQASGESFFFTDQMADQYIEDAARCCLREIDALFSHRSGVDELALAWKRV